MNSDDEIINGMMYSIVGVTVISGSNFISRRHIGHDNSRVFAFDV